MDTILILYSPDVAKCDVTAIASLISLLAVAVNKLLNYCVEENPLRAVHRRPVRGTAGESRRSSEKGGYLKIRQYVPGYQPDVKTVKSDPECWHLQDLNRRKTS